MDDFDDFINNMIQPLDNPDFYALILADRRYSSGGAFSLCHEYDLGSTTFKSYHQLLSVALSEYLKNMNTYEKYKIKNPNKTIEQYQAMKDVLTKVINNPREMEGFLQRNSTKLKAVLGVWDRREDGQIHQKGWIYFKSHHLNPNDEGNSIHATDVKHRLYLTVDTEQRALLAKLIIQKCNQKQLPYNFKVHTNFCERKENQQSDTVVIYLSEEKQVLEYVKFINEIIEENPMLKHHIHKPSPHLGIVNDAIGYGFEPKIDGVRTSYSKILKESIPLTLALSLYKNILSLLADKKTRKWYDIQATSDEGYRILPPSEHDKLEIESADECKELMRISKEGKLQMSDYARLKKIFSAYFRRKNMHHVDELQPIRDQISKRLITKYPNIPKNNSLGIDVEEVLYEMQLDEDER